MATKNKGDVENLQHHEAIEKIKELVNHINICLFTTNLSTVPLSARPMSTQEVDDEGVLWFFSPNDSEKNEDILQDSRVQLFYSNTGKSEFLSIYGHAFIVDDQQKVEELWNPMAKAWFQDGKDDPQLTLIKVVPEDAYYWDTKNGKIISMVKILTSVVSGKTMDDGVQGKLHVK